MCELTTPMIRVRVEPDRSAENPREAFDNLGTMVTWGRRYALGDPHDFVDPVDFADAVTDRNAVILPVYVYDHSVVLVSTRSFLGRAPHAEWDSGQVGYIYVTKARLRQEYSVRRVTRAIRARAEAVLEAEVEQYSDYLRGAVYGYIVEAVRDCPTCGQEDAEILDSCWGFYGADPEQNGMADEVEPEYRAALLEACAYA